MIENRQKNAGQNYRNRQVLAWLVGAGLSTKLISQLLAHYQVDEIESVAREDFHQIDIPSLKIQSLIDFKKKFSAHDYIHYLQSLEVNVVTYFDHYYPNLLKNIPHPPMVLFFKGKLKSLNNPVAVVGTRKPTSYGKRACQIITSDLISAGCCIVSGLAYGVDAIAHQTTLDLCGQTIAVLGNGIDQIQPTANQTLGLNIIQSGGALISEYPPEYPALKQNFPARNRLVSGMSRAVIVVEGGDKSGSMITADFARQQKKHLFAIPGEITNHMSQGPNKLIKRGAQIVTSGQDILGVLELEEQPTKSKRKILSQQDFNSTHHWLVYQCLIPGKLTSDEIIRSLNFEPAQVSSILMQLLLEEKIKDLGNAAYSIY